MAIKTISQFDAATPTSNDKILFEQNGEGKSAILEDLPISIKTQTALNAKVDTANVLTLEEIKASTDLTGKAASASSVKEINQNMMPLYTMGNADDSRNIVGIGASIIQENSVHNAYIIFNIAWISLRFKIAPSNCFVSFKYGANPWSEWRQII